MKSRTFFAAAVVFSGIVLAFLVCMLTSNFHAVSLALSRFFGVHWSVNVFMYAAAVIVPLLAGVFMILVIFLVFREEGKDFAKRLKDARKSTDECCGECERRLDSIAFSIMRIKESSERLKRETERLYRLNRRLENPGRSLAEDVPGKTPAAILGDYPVRWNAPYEGERVLPELVQFPQFHHRGKDRPRR